MIHADTTYTPNTTCTSKTTDATSTVGNGNAIAPSCSSVENNVLPKGVKLVGTLDFTFKIGFASLERDFGEDPLWHWWGVFLIRVPTTLHTLLLQAVTKRTGSGWRVVENINAEWYLVQHDPLPLAQEMLAFCSRGDWQRILQPTSLPSADAKQDTVTFQHIYELSTIINDEVCPCIASVAEVLPTPASGRFVHVGLAPKRKFIVDLITELRTFAQNIHLVTSMVPALQVCDYVS